MTHATQHATQAPAPKLSVLVPVFNAEPFLRECLDSLVGQTLRDLEIICINDGSTDGSAAILAEYAARDGRIRVITKANSGYGDSMNRGMDAARGEWVGICEPDDFCDLRMYHKLVRAAERRGADIAKANYASHCEGVSPDPTVEVLAGFPYKRPFSLRDNPTLLYTDPTIWAAVYRRSMLMENGVRFTTSPGASFQDASFAHQCWISARSVVLLRDGLYHYRIDNAASSVKSGAKVFAVCDEYDHSLAFLRARGAGDLEAFGPYLTVLRFAVYVWNYNRISAEHHLPFVQRWVSDMVDADDQGLLRPELFTPQHSALLQEICTDPEAFCAAHEDGVDYVPIK